MTLSKKYGKWLLIGALGVIVLGNVFVAMLSTRPLADDAIKRKFKCDRVTADARSTDVYCKDPGLYREHLKNGDVIRYP